jgi:hypothetical protein
MAGGNVYAEDWNWVLGLPVLVLEPPPHPTRNTLKPEIKTNEITVFIKYLSIEI